MQGTYDQSEVTTVLWLAIDEAEPFVYVRASSTPEHLKVLP